MPKSVTQYVFDGVIKHNQGKYLEAIADYNEAIRLAPKFSLAFYHRSAAKFILGRHDEATADYNKFVRLNPKLALSFSNHCTTKSDAGKRMANVSKILLVMTQTLILLIAMSFVLSIIYYWGYFYALGIAFSAAPMIISDYLKSAIDWIPQTIILFGTAYIFELALKRIEGGGSEEELINSTSNPKFTRIIRGPVCIVMIIIYLGTIPLLIFSGENIFSTDMVSLLVILWLFFYVCLSRIKAVENWPHAFRLAMVYAPIICFNIFAIGFQTSYSLVNSNNSDYVLSFGITGDRQVNVNVLKTLEMGVLVDEPSTKKVIFLPWNEGFNISKKYGTNDKTRGVISDKYKWFNLPVSQHGGEV